MSVSRRFRGHDLRFRNWTEDWQIHQEAFDFSRRQRCKFILIYERFPSQHTIHNKLLTYFSSSAKALFFPSALAVREKNYIHDVVNVDYDVFHISLASKQNTKEICGRRRCLRVFFYFAFQFLGKQIFPPSVGCCFLCQSCEELSQTY